MSLTIEVLTERVAVLEKQIALLMSDKAASDITQTTSNTTSKSTKTTKKSKSDSDDKPKKKRTSGYILFSNAHRDEVKESFASDSDKPKNTEIMKKLALMWKQLDDAQREQWNLKAKEIKSEEEDDDDEDHD